MGPVKETEVKQVYFSLFAFCKLWCSISVQLFRSVQMDWQYGCCGWDCGSCVGVCRCVFTAWPRKFSDSIASEAVRMAKGPIEAKRLGRLGKLREDWEEIKSK